MYVYCTSTRAPEQNHDHVEIAVHSKTREADRGAKEGGGVGSQHTHNKVISAWLSKIAFSKRAWRRRHGPVLRTQLVQGWSWLAEAHCSAGNGPGLPDAT
ncbi:hypothetical protein ElyMa_005519000 [Elysia marginata]|uniref:Uncharacterized protein n=1 Tax=Elysia marginata TaxID=1093978 RepID=A0AAV4EXC1_9GAST|nr:hypothetical protein ElyMa_005519000 [Elysia marginata]